jgi:hypothetical protein
MGRDHMPVAHAPLAGGLWYAPHNLVIDLGGRDNSSRPGNIPSHRLSTTTMWTPSARRSFSTRVIGGSEGWQIVRTGITRSRFHSAASSLAGVKTSRRISRSVRKLIAITIRSTPAPE